MKNRYSFLCVLLSLFVLFVFCRISASYEMTIRDTHRFLNGMPFAWLNYLLCYMMILVSVCFSCIDYCKGKAVSKKQVLFLMVSFLLVASTTVRNHIYYSNELELLKGCYTEEIQQEELERRIEKGESFLLYVNAGTWEEAYQGYELVRSYAYGEQRKIYVFSAQNKPELFSEKLKNIFREMAVTSLPAFVQIENGVASQVMDSQELCTWLTSYSANPN